MKYARPTSYTGQRGTETLTGDLKVSGITEEILKVLRQEIASIFLGGDDVLVAGETNVVLPEISNKDRVFVTRTLASGICGFLEVHITAGAGFRVRSVDLSSTPNTGDVSSFSWLVIKNV